MSLLKQLLLGLAVVAVALVVWVRFVPSALPLLERIGVLDRLEAVGLAPSAAEGSGASSPGAGGFVRRPATVVAAPPGEGILNDVISAIGSGQAIRSVVVAPEVSGRLLEISVASGQRVESGQVIARLESEAEQIAQARAALVVADARDRSERVARLQASGAVTDLQIREADLALSQAELALRQTDFDLARRTVRAPISGWVGIVAAEVGKQVSATTELTQIDDRSSLLVDFRVPERFVGLIRAGDTIQARPLSRADEILTGVVTALDNRVDPASRTLLVQAQLPNDDDRLRAGMAFAISVAMPGEVYPSVDPLSVQWGGEGAFVWLVRDGRAQRLTVRIVRRSADEVLLRAEFLPDDVVVIEGVQALRPGAEVLVRPPDAETGDSGAARDAEALTTRSRI